MPTHEFCTLVQMLDEASLPVGPVHRHPGVGQQGLGTLLADDLPTALDILREAGWRLVDGHREAALPGAARGGRESIVLILCRDR